MALGQRAKEMANSSYYSRSFGWLLQAMFPYSENPNPLGTEKSLIFPVTLLVPTDFRFPKFRPGLRDMSTRGTAVPKTSIYKDRKSLFTEIKIWFSTDRCRVKHPALDPGPDKCHLKGNFGRPIIPAANRRHGSSALRRHVGKQAIFKF
jgi:hypothetical protein